jgi:prevent-host-death family protein
MRPTHDDHGTTWRPETLAEQRFEMDSTPVISMRDLNQHTSTVIDEINDHGCPTLVTKHGRFIALITPLAGRSIESIVLSTDPRLRALMPNDQAATGVGSDADLMLDEFHERLRDEREDK